MWELIIYLGVLTIVTYVVKQLVTDKPNFIKFRFKFFIFYFFSMTLALILAPFFVFNPKNVKNSLFAANILKHTTKLLDLKWELRNGKILAEDKGAVVVANHQSSLDILGMFNIWHVMDKCAAVARKEVFYYWPFGLAAYLAGVVFIDRNNPKDSYRQLDVTSEVMIKNRTKLWLFPEGTRNKNGRKLLPFKRGAFKIAVSAQVPLIPVVYSPYYFINSQRYLFNKGHIIIQVLEPIQTAGLTVDDIPALMNKVHELMQNTYQELTKETLNSLPADYPLPQSRD